MNLHIDFMGKRWWMLGFSAVVLIVGIGGLVFKGLNFGIEFKGGTVLTFEQAQNVTTEQVRKALDAAKLEGAKNANIQTASGGSYIVRLSEPDAQKASAAYPKVIESLKLPAQETNVTTIGPGWGRVVTNSALMALLVSLAVILLVITLGYEYKMSVTAVVALAHDAVIVLGIYALSGREVTPNTFAALLTILGFSLYDTIVVFHRIKENGQRLVRQSFMQMANESINQVFIRSVNTSLIQVVPIIALAFFGGETLKDFAFAMLIGVLSGAYSSIAVASPIFAMWKEREPRFQALKKKYGTA